MLEGRQTKGMDKLGWRGRYRKNDLAFAMEFKNGGKVFVSQHRIEYFPTMLQILL
jgi:hypothetical protein